MVGRSSLRTTKRRPDQFSSIAQTLLSTSPLARPYARTCESFNSVASGELCLGQATQRPPDGSSRDAARSKRRLSSPSERTKTMRTSNGPFPFKSVRHRTLGGRGSSSARKWGGAPDVATSFPSLIPSFFGSGVPEYPTDSGPSSGLEGFEVLDPARNQPVSGVR